ncbi:MAG: heme/hemin ABC transporter substrate-binding protein [Methylococcales bacterium]
MMKLRFGLFLCYAACTLVLPISDAVVADGMPRQVADRDSKLEFMRVVVAGGALTEIVYALGEENRLAGVDSTSQWPEAARTLPQVGYLRNLSAEGILSLSPSLLLTTDDAGPPAVLEQIKQAGVRMMALPDEHTRDGVLSKVRRVAGLFNASDRGERLAARIQDDFMRLEQLLSRIESQPKVTFFLTVSGGSPMAAGRGTAADAMIRLAGGQNALSSYRGYKPVSVESLIQAAPDVLVIAEPAINAPVDSEEILRLPGIGLTPAGRERRLIFMDAMYLLGFGPRTGRAALELAGQLHFRRTTGATHE